MKVFNFFAQIFTIFAYLTLGSLLIIFGAHLLEMDNVLLRIREIYSSPWKSTQAFTLGLLFISVGLQFTKNLVKKTKVDAVIFQSEIGPIVISVQAIDDVTRKVIKRFHLVKESKVSVELQHRDVEVKMNLVLWSGGHIQELLFEIQNEVKSRIQKLLGPASKIEITCDVLRIEDHEVDLEDSERQRAAI